MPTASHLITKFSDLSTETIHFGTSKPNSRGGKNVPLYDNSGNKLVISLQKTACWGMNENVDESSGRKSYSINLRLGNESPMTNTFQIFENWVVAECVKNGKEWFGKAMNEDVVRALFYPILKYPKNKDTGESDTSRDPSVKLKVPFWEGDFKCELYSMKGDPLYTPKYKLDGVTPLDMVPMNSDIKALVQCDGIWFTAGRCGVTFKLLQAKVEEPVRLEGGCFIDSSDDDEEEEDVEHVEHVEHVETVSPTVESIVADSGSDSDAIHSAEEVVQEKPKPKRKRVVKKKVAKE